MSLFNSKAKSQKSNKKTTFLRGLILIFAVMVSVLTFSACKLIETNNGGSLNFDADGKLRISAPQVNFDKYTLGDGGAKVIDENAGSFSWAHQYFYAEKGIKTTKFDQENFLNNFYTTPDYNDDDVFFYSAYTALKPIYTDSIDELKAYYSAFGDDILNSTTTEYPTMNAGEPNFYAYHKETVGADVTHKFIQVYTPIESIYENENATNLISFPNYEVIIDGKYYLFKVTLNKEHLGINPDKSTMNSQNIFVDNSADHSLFTFKYRVGKYNNGDYTECTPGHMTYYVDAKTGKFMIRFNPMLEAGTTQRYIKIKSLSTSGNRGDSIYSNTIAYDAYTMTFNAYSPNSADLSYETLNYDETKYYFHNITTVYENDRNLISSMTGTFPEGKKVVVERKVVKANDFALQSWTTNAKAENSLIIPYSYAGSDWGIPFIKSTTETVGAIFKYGGINYDVNCIPGVAVTNSEAFANVISSIDEYVYNYCSKTTTISLPQVVQERLTDDGSNVIGTLTAVSHSYLNNYKFYANFARVKNFSISGTLFNGDNFFTSGNQYLTDANISVFKDNGSSFEALGTLVSSKTSELIIEGEGRKITATFDGAEFKVIGLEYNEVLLFEKMSDATTAGRIPFSFHSPLMSKEEIFDGIEYKVLGTHAADDLYSDRKDVGVIGTLYEENSSLVVNLYQTTSKDDVHLIDGTNLKPLQDGAVNYEIIESVSSYEDANGYITTNVIISLLLPSNATLVGYNTETLNNKTAVYYAESKYATTPNYVLMQSFDEKTLKFDVETVYSIAVQDNIGGVAVTDNSIYVSYGGSLYVYDHKVVNGTNGYLYYYNDISYTDADENNNDDLMNVLVTSDPSKPSGWSLITYSELGENNWGYVEKEQDGKSVFEFSVDLNGDEEADCTLYPFSKTEGAFKSESNEVSYLLDGYQTEMKHDSETIFVYYDVKTYNGVTLFVAPVGQQVDVINNDGTITKQTTKFYSEISNFDALKTAKKIMLGSEIMTSDNDNARIFREALGAKITQTGLYYIVPLETKMTLHVKQYISTVNDNEQTVTTVTYLQKDGSSYIQYNGTVLNQPRKDDSGNRLYDATVVIRNTKGQEIKTEIYSKISDFKTLYDASGNKLALGVQQINPKNYQASHNKIGSVATYNYIGDSSGKSIRYAYTLYEIKRTANNVELVTTNLFFDGSNYYRITNEGYYNVETSYGTTEVQYAAEYDDANPIKLKLKDINSNSILDWITVTEINDVSTGIKYNKNRVTISGSSVSVDKEEITEYGAFLIPSYFISTITEEYITESQAPIYTTSTSSDVIADGSKYYLNLLNEDGSTVSTEVYLDVSSGLYYYHATPVATGFMFERPILNKNSLLVDYVEQGVGSGVYNERVVYYYYDRTKPSSNKTIRVYKNPSDDAYYYDSNFNTNMFNNDGYLISTIGEKLTQEVRHEDQYYLKLNNDDSSLSDIAQYFKIDVSSVYSYRSQVLVYQGSGALSGKYYYDSEFTKEVDKSKLDNPIIEQNTETEKWYLSFDLYDYSQSKTVVIDGEKLVRSAQLESTNDFVTLLGKYIPTSDQPIIYPSFSILNDYSDEELATITKLKDGSFDHYYTLDYTSKNIVVEGFPGASLLAGIPYPNPVFKFSVRHKANEKAVVNISFDIKNAYYVEMLGTNIQTEGSNLIKDFTTFSFKDTITNLTLSDYISKTYYILDKNTLETIVPYYKVVGVTTEYKEKYLDADGNPLELKIQDIYIDDYGNLYFKDQVSADGSYTTQIYRKLYNSIGDAYFEALNEKDLIVWSTSSVKIESAPAYDIHSYYQDLDGIIYFNSGTSTDDNAVCLGLEGITAGATNSESGAFNYDQVLVSGVTYAFRTKTSELYISDGDFYGYWFDKPLNIVDAYNSKEAYFLSGKESAIMIASPTVNVVGDNGLEYIYRFKEWKVFSRYNSEVLYYNRGVTESLVDRYNAILRFTSYEAGYFVVLPVYQRVYTIDLGTEVVDGPINQGGGITINYSNGAEVDVNNSYNEILYSVEYLKTNYNDQEAYYYTDLRSNLYLWFTGDYTSEEDGKQPIFELRKDIYSLSAGGVTFYYSFNYEAGKIKGINMHFPLTSFNKAGLVEVYNDNGLYLVSATKEEVFEDDDSYYIRVGKDGYKTAKFGDLVNYSFMAKFFYDSLTGDSSKYSYVPVYYDEPTKTFYRLDINNIKGKKFEELITDKIGISVQNNFRVLNTVNDNSYINGLYVSRNGSLYAGELVMDENGKLFSTLQFKSAYIDRDSYVILEAVPDVGYRVEGWYKCIFNESINAWVTTDEKVENSDAQYSDEVLQAHYNKINKTYYFVTDYKSDPYVGKDGSISYIYYVSADSDKEAIVPDNMLDKVRGYFIAESKTSINGKEIINYVQVYVKRGLAIDEYFYDPAFSQMYEGSSDDVVEMTYLDAINLSGANDDDVDNEVVTLSNNLLYRVFEEQLDGSKKVRYYRVKENGNIMVDGNNLYIQKLHSNVRYVAKFIEIYNEYIYAEDEDASGIKIQAIYYNNSDASKADDEQVIIRTDAYGFNQTTNDIKDSNVLEENLFNLYEEGRTGSIKFNSAYMNTTFTMKDPKDPTKVITANYYSQDSIKAFNALTVAGFADKTYGNQYVGSTYKVEVEDGKLNMKSMYFDTCTTVYILVSVKADFELNIHSLGMNSTYELTPIIQPNSDYIAYNQTLDDDKKVDYTYYLFKVSYDRDPENENFQYLVHSARGNSIVADIYAGNEFDYYNNKGFTLYDNDGRLINTNPAGVKTLKANLNVYFTTLKNLGVISTETYNEFIAMDFKNIREALEELNNTGAVNNGGKQLEVAYLKHTSDPSKQLTNVYEIIEIIKKLKKDEGSPIPYLITTGQRNFINLSTIPIYSYIIQSVTLDTYTQTSEINNVIMIDGHKYTYNNNKGHKLQNSIYTAAGTNGKTYLGSGTKNDLTATPYVYSKGGVSSSKFEFKTQYTALPYLDDLTGGSESSKTILQDVSLAEDTIMLLSGIDDDIKAGYAFVGWYEQKFDRTTNSWTELALMSTDLKYPYLSVATADTIILAVFKKLVTIEIKYNKNEFTVQLPNGWIDSTGATISESTVDNNVTITGNFYFDAVLDINLTPIGGYRFKDVKYNYDSHKSGTLLNNLSFKNSKGEEKTSSNIILNDNMTVSIPFKKLIGLNADRTFDDYDNLTLTLESKRITLFYATVSNFYNISDGFLTKSGVDVKLIGDGKVYLDTSKHIGADSTQLSPGYKDSTNNNISYNFNENNLYFYGYFDTDKTLNIETTYPADIDFKHWYINNYESTTSSSEFHSYEIMTSSSSGSNATSKLELSFVYDNSDPKAPLNNYFDLDEENTVMFAEANIKGKIKTVYVAHTISDSSDNIEKKTGTQISGITSMLYYNGQPNNGALNNPTIVQYDALNPYRNQFSFTDESSITLVAQKQFVNVGGEDYMFYGWFHSSTESFADNKTSNAELISTSLVVGSQPPTGFYEARYIRIQKLTIFAHDTCTYQVSDDCFYNSTGNYYYVYAGNNPTLTITPAPGYLVKSVQAYDIINTSVLSDLVITKDDNKYTIQNINKNAHIKILCAKALNITINQVVYDSLEMLQDGEYLSTVGNNSEIMIDGVIYKTLTHQVLAGSHVKFMFGEDYTNYYFAGWYINGELVSVKGTTFNEYATTITEDIVIEARFVPVISVSFNAKVFIGGSYSNVDPTYFLFTATYKDIRTDKKKILNDVGTYYKLPSGLSYTLREVISALPYQFQKWVALTTSIIDLTIKDYTTVVIDTELANASMQVNIVAMYSAYSTLNISKEIETEQTITNELKSNLDIQVQYYDLNNVKQSISLGSILSLNNIKIYYNSNVEVKVYLADKVKDSFFPIESTVTQDSITSNLSLSKETYTIVQTVDVKLTNIYVKFADQTIINLSKELNGELTSSEDINVLFELTRDGLSNTTSLNDLDFKSYQTTTSDTYKITAVIYDSIKNAIFAGWYLNGEFLTSEKTITKSDLPLSGNISLVAKFYTVANVSMSVVLNDSETLDDAEPSIAGIQAVLQPSGEYKLVQNILTSLSPTSYLIYTNSDIVLTTNTIAGYRFEGFTLKYTIDGEVEEKNATQITNTYRTVSNIEMNVQYESLEIIAKYVSISSVSYVINTTNTETDDNTEVGGSVASSSTTYITYSNKNIKVNYVTNGGYKLVSYYFNDTITPVTTNTGVLNLTPNKTQDHYVVQLNFVKIVKLQIRLSINGTNDAYEIASKFNINLNNIFVNVGSDGNHLDNTTSSVYYDYKDQTLIGSIIDSISISYFDDVEYHKDIIGEDGTTYYFTGWYIFDGEGVATSVNSLTPNSVVRNIILDDNLSIIAKYESEKPVEKTIKTNLSYEFINSIDDVQSFTTAPSYSTNGDGTINYNGNKYLNCGYFIQLNDNKLSYRYIRIADPSLAVGLYSNIVLRFVKINELTLSESTKFGMYSVTHINQRYNAFELYLNTSINLNGVITTPFLASSNIKYTINALDGFNVDPENKSAAMATYTNNLNVVNESQNIVAETNPIGIQTTVVVSNKANGSITIDRTKTAIQKVIDDYSVKFDVQIQDAKVNLSISSGTESELIVTTLDVYGNSVEYIITSTASKDLTLPVGSVISLAVSIATNEAFGGYKINGTTFDDSILIYEYYITSNADIEIRAIFSAANSIVILENDFNAGNATVSQTGSRFTINIIAKYGYRISSISLAELTDGTLTYFNILENINAADSIVSILSEAKTNATSDSSNNTYIQSFSANLRLSKTVALSVKYEKVTKILINWYSDDEGATNTQYNLYMFDNGVDEFAFTIDRYNALVLNISDPTLKTNLFYTDATDILKYEGIVIGPSTTIYLSNLKEITISMFRKTQLNVIVKIQVIIDVDAAGNSIYEVPTDGLEVSYNGITYSTDLTNAAVMKYMLSTSTSIISTDKNEFFLFNGYYNEEYTSDTDIPLSKSSEIVLTSRDFGIDGRLSQDASGNYVLYAVFEEIIHNIVVEVPSGNPNNYTLYAAGETQQITTDLKRIKYDGYGFITVQSNTEKTEFYINYPHSFIASDQSFIILNAEYVENTTDPTLAVGEKYYDYHGAEGDFRMYSFTDSKGNIIGDLYDQQIELKFSDYQVGEIITANAKKLSLIEFAYTYYLETNPYKISLSVLDNNGDIVALISTTSNNSTMPNILLSFWAEEGVLVKASVTDLGGLPTGIAFRDLLIASDDVLTLASVLTDKTLSDDTNDQTTWQDNWLASFDIYAASTYNKPNTEGLSANSLSTFYFQVTKDVSILADFFGIDKNDKKLPVLINGSPSYDLSGKDNKPLPPPHLNGSETSKQEIFIGNGFKLLIVSENSKVEYRIDDTKQHQENAENNYIYVTNLISDSDLDENSDALKFDFTMPKTQVDIRLVQKISTTFRSGAFKANKLEFGAGVIVYQDLPRVGAEKMPFNDAYVTYFIDTPENVIKQSSEESKVQYTSKIEITAQAKKVEGFFFKGFAIFSSSYSNNIIVSGFGGENVGTNLTTYTLLSANDKGSYYQAKFYLDANMYVVALYESRPYVINVKSYTYFPDNSNPLVNEAGNREEITAGTIKGKLIIEHGETRELTSIVYPYKQFVGFSTSEAHDYANLINVNWYSGSTKEAEIPTEAETTLRSTTVYPKVNDDGSYASSATRNTLQIYNIQSDIDIYVYYTALSYNLTIDLGEIVNAYVYPTPNSSVTQDTYLVYADFIREQTDWKNPSYGEYIIKSTNGSQDSNMAKSSSTIKIEENDPYVYTLVEVDTEYRMYPTKIQSSLICHECSAQAGHLCYKQSKCYNNTHKSSQEVLIAKVGGVTASAVSIEYDDKIDAVKEYYGFDEKHKNYKKIIQDLGSMYLYGFTNGQPELNAGNKISFDNIYNYIKYNPAQNNYTIKDNLIKVEIAGVEADAFESVVDIVSNTIYLKYKVVADETGFPAVSVSYGSHKLPTSINKYMIKTNKYIPSTQSETIRNISKLQGFNLGLYEDDASFTDPTYDIGNLDVNVTMLWAQKAVAVEAKVVIDGGKEVNLTGNAKTIDNLSLLKCKSKNECDRIVRSQIHSHEYEIEAYYLIIVENGQIVLEFLDKLSKLDLDFSWWDGVVGKDDHKTAAVLQAKMLALCAGKINDATISEIGSHIVNPNGLLGGDEDYDDLKSLWRKYAQLLGYDPNNEEYIKLNYRIIDTFEYFRSDIDHNLYGNYMNANDIVISQVILQEHQISQHNNKTKKIFKAQIILSADKGYNYFRGASLGFGSSAGSKNGLPTTEYNNDFSEIADDTSSKDTGFWKDTRNYIVGMFNGDEKYSGTFSRVMHYALYDVIDCGDLVEDYVDKYIYSYCNISTRDDDQVLSAVHDWDQPPFINAAFSFIVYAGPWGKYVALIDGAIKLFFPGKKTIYETVLNLNF